jgi:gamma-glutamyltranspeptidase/glutathione hydrolase
MPRHQAFRDFEQGGRSEAFGLDGMVATSHPMATLAAVEVLRDGGNAVDAAVCAAAMQAVVEPTQSGLGGDTFALVMHENAGEPLALDGSGWAPRAATADWYAERGIDRIEIESAHAVTVPGAVAAWERLALDHGSIELARLLAPAIEAAEHGCPIPERLARDWALQTAKLSRSETAARSFLFDGKPPVPGTVHRQPQLARALRSIASDGSAAFYAGWIAEDMVAALRAAGGLHTRDDFADFAPEYVTPISASYRGYELWECPPSGQGLVPLVMAKALEGFSLADWAPVSVERFHVQAEIGRIAYAERDLFIADPRQSSVPVDWLLSDAHAASIRARISLGRRIPSAEPVPLPNHADTVFIAVVDRNRTAVALISSIFEDFGSGIVSPRSGIVLHNRASGFSLEPGHPNMIAGRKRPFHTIIPAILSKHGRPVMTFGVTGAHFQPFGQIQVLTNVIDHEMPLQAAIDAPRMFARGDVFEIEHRVPEKVAAGLTALGHAVTRPSSPLGTAQAIWIDHERGILRGGADGRRDGLALGY